MLNKEPVSIRNWLKIAENPCFVLTIPKWENLDSALPIVKQRLCEIMHNPALYPRGNINNDLDSMNLD